MTKEAVLQACIIEGQIVKLPAQLPRDLYIEVKKVLEKIGGKWKGGKVQGFVFGNDPTSLLKQVGAGVKRDIKKEYQFYATPASLADDLVKLAEIEEYDNVLEPSAGHGAIIKAIHRAHPGHPVHYFELMDENRAVCSSIPDAFFLAPNFLTKKVTALFHKIIANPPFANNQDIDHVYKMWDSLCPGGKLVSIISVHSTFASGKKETAFREWLRDVNAVTYEVAMDAFKESGANVRTCIIVINKPL